MNQRATTRLAVLMTCHNRRDTTLACLESLYHNDGLDSFEVDVFLMDDGSTDETETSVLQRFPEVNVIRGDGNLFWTRGMYLVFERAMGKGFDFYLWLNDDTHLSRDAIVRLKETFDECRQEVGAEPIVVGSTKSQKYGTRTYGGSIRRRGVFRKPEPVVPQNVPIECNAMNGNIVLIPKGVASVVGNLDYSFQHSLGDIDYALRAGKKGVKIFVAPGFLGVCEHNSVSGTYQDFSLPRRRQWSLLTSKKGLPPMDWLIFTRRHFGAFWPIYWVWPYLKVWIKRRQRG